MNYKDEDEDEDEDDDGCDDELWPMELIMYSPHHQTPQVSFPPSQAL